jgi:cytochrome c
VSVAPAGDVAASAGWDRTVRLWDIATGREIRRLDHPSGVDAVVFGKDGKTLFSGDKDGTIRIWDTATGTRIGILQGHDMAVTHLAVSPDGSRLLSAGIDETVRLWDPAGRTEVRTMTGHKGPVFGVAFSPDGTSALSGGRDGWVIHWSLETGQPIQFIQAHDEPVWAVAFSPDGRFAMSASSDETVRVWHLGTGERIGLPGEGDSEPKPWLDSTHPGAKLYRSCATCHSLQADGVRRSGPTFAHLFGRRAGSVPGYSYSAALREATFVWNEQTLGELFEKGPATFLPGTKMPLQRIADREALDSLIDYLKILTSPKESNGTSQEQ